MEPTKNYNSVPITDKSTIRVRIKPTPLIRRFLSHIPSDHLEDLDEIIVVDCLQGIKCQKDPWLYRKKTKVRGAQIELSLYGIYNKFPDVITWIPFLEKLMLATEFFGVMGHHHAHQTGGVNKKEWPIFIKTYKKTYTKKTFPISGKVFKILRPYILKLLKFILKFL